MALVAKITNLIALLVTVAWLARWPDWEPAALAISLLGTLVGLEYRDRKRVSDLTNTDRLEHDRTLFKQYAEILPEDRLRHEFDNDLFNHYTDLGFANRLSRFVEFAKLAEAEFLTDAVQADLLIARDAIEKLRGFILVHFFPPQGEQLPEDTDHVRLILYPELRQYADVPGELSDRYREYAKDLDRCVEGASGAFSKFRSTAKSELSV